MSDTIVSTASVATERGARYGKQLVSHLGRITPIAKWLAAHSRFRWFALLTDQQLRRGVHTSIYALEKDIRDWITTWNQDAKPSAWTTTADDIPERLASYLHSTLGARCLSAHP
jgi:hypothetical protein